VAHASCAHASPQLTHERPVGCMVAAMLEW
jgi:hypothetical protein